MITSKDLHSWKEMYNNARPSIKSKRDLITIFLHWNILNKKTSFLEVDDEKTKYDNEIHSKVLPINWNKDDKYMLKYKDGDELYILIGFELHGVVALYNFLRISDINVSSLVVDIENTVKSLDGTIKEMIPDYEHLMEIMEKHILHRNIDKSMICDGTQTQDIGLLLKSNRGGHKHDHNYEYVTKDKIATLQSCSSIEVERKKRKRQNCSSSQLMKKCYISTPSEEVT